MATTRAHRAPATSRQGDPKASMRRSTGEAARERLLTGVPVTERRLELAGDPPDAERVAAWLGELIERTCPSPPALVGHGLGGAIAARFAAAQGDRVARLVLVDSYGLARYRPTPRFTLAMLGAMARPTERTQERLFRQCVTDLDGLREQLGDWGALLEAYALDRARSPGQKAALRSLIPPLGPPVIPPAELARIAVPTSLIWGRHDRQVRLEVARAASARHRWPLHVIEDAADDPAVEQPEAFLRGVHAALGPGEADPRRQP